MREKRLAQELANAKRERDFYLSQVSRAKKSEAIVARKRQVRLPYNEASLSRALLATGSTLQALQVFAAAHGCHGGVRPTHACESG